MSQRCTCLSIDRIQNQTKLGGAGRRYKKASKKQTNKTTRQLVQAAKKRSFSKRYMTRPSPPWSAREIWADKKRATKPMRGNDGNLYVVRVSRSTNIPRWVRY